VQCITRHKPPESHWPAYRTQVVQYSATVQIPSSSPKLSENTMSSLIRLSKTLRTLRTPRTAKTMSSHFFFPSHSPGLPHSRFYSSGGGYSGREIHENQNLAVLYTLMGANVAVWGYAMYVKQQAMVRSLPQSNTCPASSGRYRTKRNTQIHRCILRFMKDSANTLKYVRLLLAT
jgi:hypothetical protein